MASPVLRVQDLSMGYKVGSSWVKAVDRISFDLARGESLGLVGESGCGKTSLAISLLRVLPDNAEIIAGNVFLDDINLTSLAEEQMRRLRWTRISMVFQAAMGSLNPVQRVGSQIVEVIQVHLGTDRAEAGERAATLFEVVGLESSHLERYPHELSGGMKQRAVIALALACEPDILIADEPTTALDVIVQHRVLQELKDVQRQRGTSMIYISHDLGVVSEVSARIAVMYAGQIVEIAETADLFDHPRHPYTKALISSSLNLQGPRRELVSLEGDPPDLASPPAGCRFHPRCPHADEICRRQEPLLEDYGPAHMVACWHPLEMSSGGPR